MNLSVLALSLVFISVANASYLVRMDTKTADISDAGMQLLGEVDVEVYNVDGDHCNISDLDSSGNNFQRGEIDVFEGGDLEVRQSFNQ